MKKTTTACNSSKANPPGSEECGFMSEMRDNVAGLCGFKRKNRQTIVQRMKTQNLNHVRGKQVYK